MQLNKKKYKVLRTGTKNRNDSYDQRFLRNSCIDTFEKKIVR